jgi:hypothetical protein
VVHTKAGHPCEPAPIAHLGSVGALLGVGGLAVPALLRLREGPRRHVLVRVRLTGDRRKLSVGSLQIIIIIIIIIIVISIKMG